MKIRIGSRGSALALAQTHAVAGSLRANGHEVEVVIIETAGDRDATSKFSDIGAPGVFVREIEAALLGGDIDMAVHSYKDLPSAEPEGLHVAAIPERLDPADYLIARPKFVVHVVGAAADAPLPLVPQAVVGTASERRRALLRALRPDLQLARIRGNVPTRLAKLREGPYQAIVLAGAGLQRLLRDPDAPELNLEDFVDLRLDPALFVPSPAQGAIALQCRRDDAVEKALAPLHDEAVARPVRAERELLRLVDGGCSLPFGAWARVFDGRRLELHAVIEADGRLVRVVAHGAEPEELAARAWEELEADGGLAGVKRGEAVE